MAEINVIAVISKLRPKVKQGRVTELDDLADEIAEQSGFDRAMPATSPTSSPRSWSATCNTATTSSWARSAVSACRATRISN